MGNIMGYSEIIVILLVYTFGQHTPAQNIILSEYPPISTKLNEGQV